MKSNFFFFSPEYGGDAVSGGGHPADSSVPALEAIEEAFNQEAGEPGQTRTAAASGDRSNPVPSQEDISRRAQALWEAEGRPEGKAEEHWGRAENELRGTISSLRDDG